MKIVINVPGFEDCWYKVDCLQEYTPVEGNAMASGDDSYDKKVEDSIIGQLNSGNEWAWCTVRVTCGYNDMPIVGVDFLGCCSYASEGDFTSIGGGYFEEMKDQAYNDFLANIQLLGKAV